MQSLAVLMTTVLLLLAAVAECQTNDAEPGGGVAGEAALGEHFTFGIFAFGAKWSAMSTMPGMPDQAPGSLPDQLMRMLYDQQARAYAAYGINTLWSQLGPGKDQAAVDLDRARDACQKYAMRLVPHGSVWDGEDSTKKVVAWWTDFVTPYVGDDTILAWAVYDEPERDLGAQFDTLTAAVSEVDAAHPVTLVTSGVWETLGPRMEYYVWDDYFGFINPFGAASTSHLKVNAAKAEACSPSVNVAVVWAETQEFGLVGPVELRAQTFAALAHGAKGIMFYSGGSRPPYWVHWTEPGLALATEAVLSSTRQSSLANPFGVSTPLLEEIGRLAAAVAPVGHLLIGAERDDTILLGIECAPLTVQEVVEDGGVYNLSALEIPAVEAAVWRRDSSRLIVAYNNDRAAVQDASIRLDLGPHAANLTLYDLWALDSVPIESGSFHVTLEPGDGRFFLLTRPNQFAGEKQTLIHNRYELERRTLLARLDVAQGCGALDVGEVTGKWIPEAEQAAADGHPKLALSKIRKAAIALDAAEADAPQYQTVKARLGLCARSLFWIDQWLRSHAPFLPDPRQYGACNENPALAPTDFERLLCEVSDAADEFAMLRADFEADPLLGSGFDLATLADKLTVLHYTCVDLAAKVAAWRPEASGKNAAKLGFVAMEHCGGLIYDRDAWEFARLSFPAADIVCLAEDGTLEVPDLGAYDVLWLDYSTLCKCGGYSYLDEGPDDEIRAPASLLTPTAVAAFQAFLKSGGGILLTGLATAYVNELGIPCGDPPVVELEKRGFVTQIVSFSDVQDYQLIGLKAVDGNESHPVFDGLDPAGVYFRTEDPLHARCRATWRCPLIPPHDNANVLACLDATRSAIPDELYYDLVEFKGPGGDGKVLACGSPAMVFHARFCRRAQAFEHLRELQTLLLNAADYLAGTYRHPFHALAPPFYHRDITKPEWNSTRTCAMSPGREMQGFPVHAPYGLDRSLYWKTGDKEYVGWDVPPASPTAWTRCDFGDTFVVSKVCVLSSKRSGAQRTDVTSFKIKLQRPDEDYDAFRQRDPDFVFAGSLCLPDAGVKNGCFLLDEPTPATSLLIYDVMGDTGSHVAKIDNVAVYAEGGSGCIQ